MRTIKFRVNQQRIRNINSVCHVYTGTNNYLELEFDFGKDWEDCVIGIAFSGKKSKPRILQNNKCSVTNDDFEDSRLSFYLVGKRSDGYRVQSQPFDIEVKE